ncbi:MAG: tRNA (adenosine(37)-N6)-threonylcarbamoyltransferase complex transferase subunit TsaD, partial [Candidatus Binatia bacterium]
MILLAIETSCDDTAAAVLAGGELRSSIVSSQDAVHGPYGGIVPE